jgi:hypothetical protein
MILIAITGTNGSGKGETVWETVARLKEKLCEWNETKYPMSGPHQLVPVSLHDLIERG